MRTTVWMMVAAAVLVGCAPAHERSQDTKAIKRLTPQQARELVARYKGQELSLDGLTTLEPDAARALMGFKGKSLSVPLLPQELGKRTPLARDTVRCLCLFHDPENPIALPSITTLDGPEAVEIATILAEVRGPLSLANLRKISPKTLAALVEKRDIEIPPLEMLELIPEPGGGPSEDFVIPEGFPAGKRQP